MKKEMIIGGMVMIILIGIVSAGLMEYYGKIVQTFEILEPVVDEEWVFYASDGHPPGGTSRWNLSINDYVSKSTPASFSNGNSKLFISESLGVESFGNVNYNISLDIKSDNESGIVTSELWFVEGNSPYSEQIFVCSVNTTSPVYIREIHNISCSSNEVIGIDPNYRFALKLISNGQISYKIYMQGKTKVEVTKQ